MRGRIPITIPLLNNVGQNECGSLVDSAPYEKGANILPNRSTTTEGRRQTWLGPSFRGDDRLVSRDLLGVKRTPRSAMREPLIGLTTRLVSVRNGERRRRGKPQPFSGVQNARPSPPCSTDQGRLARVVVAQQPYALPEGYVPERGSEHNRSFRPSEWLGGPSCEGYSTCQRMVCRRSSGAKEERKEGRRQVPRDAKRQQHVAEPLPDTVPYVNICSILL